MNAESPSIAQASPSRGPTESVVPRRKLSAVFCPSSRCCEVPLCPRGSLSPFAKLMSKFLPGFLTASVDFQWISSGNFIFLPDFQLEISQISLSNSRSDLKVKVGQLAFPRSNYLSKLKILTEIRISSVDFQWISSGNFGFLRIFFPRIPAKNLDINFANGDICG